MSTLKWGTEDVSAVKWGTEDVNEIKWRNGSGVTQTVWTSYDPYFDNLNHLDAVDVSKLPATTDGSPTFKQIYEVDLVQQQGHQQGMLIFHMGGIPSRTYTDGTAFSFTSLTSITQQGPMNGNTSLTIATNWSRCVYHNTANSTAKIFDRDQLTVWTSGYTFNRGTFYIPFPSSHKAYFYFI